MFAKPGSKAKGVSSLFLTGAAGGDKPPTSSKPPTAAALKTPPEEKRLAYETIPLESQAARTSAEQCAAIKARYGPYLGQRVISTLLSFDTFRTAWKVAYRRLPLTATQEEKNAHAFEWFHEWADWVEAIDRGLRQSQFQALGPASPAAPGNTTDCRIRRLLAQQHKRTGGKSSGDGPHTRPGVLSAQERRPGRREDVYCRRLSAVRPSGGTVDY